MLPETIDDLLDVAKSGEGDTAGLSSAVAMMEFASPCVILLASGDGSLIFSDDFGLVQRRNSLPTWLTTWHDAWKSRMPVRSRLSRLSMDAFAWR